jgi:anti-sigma regulatory factor (Ser/Thr protein kinase)
LNAHGRSTEHALPGGAESIGAAREYTRRFLLEADPPVSAAMTQDVLLAVSELVTNAVRHAPGACSIAMSLEGSRIRISVTDTSRDLPSPRAAQFDGSGGFGLNLLRLLAGEVETVRHANGKTVSVSLDQAARVSGRVRP